MPNHIGSLLSKREYHYVLAVNWTPHIEALLSQWLYISLRHGMSSFYALFMNNYIKILEYL